MANSPQVERAMTREELMAMREVARKAWAAARGYHNEVMGTENAAFDAWADHHFPLPAPEPQQTGETATRCSDEHRAMHDECLAFVGPKPGGKVCILTTIDRDRGYSRTSRFNCGPEEAAAYSHATTAYFMGQVL